MTFPKTGGSEWAASQASPWTPVNGSIRRVDALASRALIVDRDLATPPGSCSDGSNYLVASSPTGAWSGQAGKMATAVGTNAANGWLFQTVAVEGYQLYVQDEDITIQHTGTAWVSIGTGGGSPVTTQTGTSYTAVLGDANSYIRFTNGSSITFTIPPNSSVAFPIGTLIEMEQGGAGALTVAAGGGVTVNSRGGDLTLAGQYSIAAVKKVATDTWTLTGDL